MFENADLFLGFASGASCMLGLIQSLKMLKAKMNSNSVKVVKRPKTTEQLLDKYRDRFKYILMATGQENHDSLTRYLLDCTDDGREFMSDLDNMKKPNSKNIIRRRMESIIEKNATFYKPYYSYYTLRREWGHLFTYFKIEDIAPPFSYPVQSYRKAYESPSSFDSHPILILPQEDGQMLAELEEKRKLLYTEQHNYLRGLSDPNKADPELLKLFDTRIKEFDKKREEAEKSVLLKLDSLSGEEDDELTLKTFNKVMEM